MLRALYSEPIHCELYSLVLNPSSIRKKFPGTITYNEESLADSDQISLPSHFNIFIVK